ncbi:MAG: DUF2905 domain-containing protein [Minisyncoccales bacterium]
MINFLAKVFISLGIFFIFLGFSFYLLSRIPFFNRMPGDILIQGKNFKFFFPITSSLILSLFLSFLFYLFSRFFKK